MYEQNFLNVINYIFTVFFHLERPTQLNQLSWVAPGALNSYGLI